MAKAVASMERAGDTREAILRAAIRAFSEKGFDGASTRDIAGAADVHHGLIRHHFGSKGKLWQASVDLAFASMLGDVESVLADAGDDRERAARIIHTHVHYVARNPEFVRLMFEEGKRRGPRMRWLVDRHVRPLYETLRPLFERGSARGAFFTETSPLHFFYVLAGAAGALFHQAAECRRVTGVDPFDAAVVDEHARVVTELFLGPGAGGSRETGGGK